ncbi:MAG: hypothetical protein P5702_11510 [Limnospira sp. PMC 1291.21]|uniref:Uncharacterized protein n=3 Tax=Limnospira TaxID=2596745 RepID=B5W255_LIMMA|nr:MULTISPECIES: hypothetical protein [Limnospira]EDZ94302.1 hypothetical protein AmaxDRAFT_2850 [Limnospira maxima CS-328]MBD2669937.1 hypothetical protein [Arthrospira platensis FACHB-439]MDC0836395.1 hypothetical protein [Limnoraphis robusta]MDY7051471.1 hypothetical protein [Limnospira fusiformis LS22]QJB27384.1 hypothetical protein HFV01_18370 [Limnospira fusiformis SAG 85.79]RAQ38678.1 hypothetical protein B9S53_26060 [Arthrospira sp. O9.13F]UWU49724.1 hypothetical protein APLC1_4602 [
MLIIWELTIAASQAIKYIRKPLAPFGRGVWGEGNGLMAVSLTIVGDAILFSTLLSYQQI